jgi:hypothetical protein
MYLQTPCGLCAFVVLKLSDATTLKAAGRSLSSPKVTDPQAAAGGNPSVPAGRSVFRPLFYSDFQNNNEQVSQQVQKTMIHKFFT